MATNGHGAYTPVLSALSTMQSNDRSQKAQAHEYLESFQKSSEAWTATFGILQSAETNPEAKLFAATTLKGKITYDLHQIPRESLPQLRDTLISILSSFAAGPRPIRTQLCVCLANLAIQMLEWQNVIPYVVSKLGSDAEHIACILKFLHVLPEEVTEGRKINLSEDELSQRTMELLQENADQVLRLLVQYAQSSPAAAKDPQLLECITSWLREVPMNDVINSPLLQVILGALGSDESFDSAVECLSAIFKETREVDDYESTIQTLYPHILALRPAIAEAAEAEDSEKLRGITRIFSEAGEAWVVLMARMPQDFRVLVECVLECAARDKERDAISQTFIFWYELKQYLTLERYMEARATYADLFSKLVDIMISHLQYPRPESGNERDLFEGDREQEEKFREFRHQMGDVLKDCCEVIGVVECLKKSYELIEQWVSVNGRQAASGTVPDWQALEAPLFSMRAMGRMVEPDENVMLPKLIPLIIQIPNQEKVRFQAVMALGRYSAWTAEHPDTLQAQLNFIMEAFNHPSGEVVRAAALAFRFFCTDCAALLKDYVDQLQQFYESVINRLAFASQAEITEGIAAVLAKQPLDKVYATFKQTCDPIMNRLMTLAQVANDKPSKIAVADQVAFVTILVENIQPYTEPTQVNPAVQYCQEIFPVLAKLVEAFSDFMPILERVCRCWRHMVQSYRSGILPLLPTLAENLSSGFAKTRQGCFLFASGSIVREFFNGAEHVDDNTSNAIFNFYEQQAVTFLTALSDLNPEELPDVIEDFFRLTIDVLLYYPFKTISCQYIRSILSAANTSLTLLKEEPLIATLHFFRDFLAYGTDRNPSSSVDGFDPTNPPEVQNAVKSLLSEEGSIVTQRILTGMMYSFPRDCLPDASGVLLGLFQILPEQTAGWVAGTISMLPEGSVTPQESQRLLGNIQQCVQAREMRKVRTVLQDFTTSYRRRNVAPREGLGRLEATKFRFAQ